VFLAGIFSVISGIYKRRFGKKETIISEIHEERILNSKSQKRKPGDTLLLKGRTVLFSAIDLSQEE